LNISVLKTRNLAKVPAERLDSASPDQSSAQARHSQVAVSRNASAGGADTRRVSRTVQLVTVRTRAEVITVGAIIIRTIMETPGQKECLVSDLGLREWVLIDLAIRI